MLSLLYLYANKKDRNSKSQAWSYFSSHKYHSLFIPEGVVVSQLFLRDAHVLPKWLSYEKYYKRVRLQAHLRLIEVSQSGVVVAFYIAINLNNIYGREKCFFFFFLSRTLQNNLFHILQWWIIIHTYIPLTLYPRRDNRGISNIPLRHPHFTKIS
jgi:hypothetical protein